MRERIIRDLAMANDALDRSRKAEYLCAQLSAQLKDLIDTLITQEKAVAAETKGRLEDEIPF